MLPLCRGFTGEVALRHEPARLDECEEAREPVGMAQAAGDSSIGVLLSRSDVALVLEALDSHEYWQIGDVLPRNDGMVWVPGDCVGPYDRYWRDEQPTERQADAIEQVRRCRALAERLRLAGAGE